MAKPKATRTNRPINTNHSPEQLKPKPTNQKSLAQNISNKSPKKSHRVTFNDTGTSAGMFMTMDEISELIKTVQDATKGEINKLLNILILKRRFSISSK